jgi:hypothetical protein
MQGMAWHGMTWNDMERHGKERKDMDMHHMEWKDNAWHAMTVITLKCTIQVYLASGLPMPLPSQSHAEQILKKPLKTSNPRPNFSLGAGNRLLSFYCTRASAG